MMYIEEQPRQPWRRCPYCGALHDGMTGVSDEPGATLSERSLLICADCGEWGLHDSTVEGGWRMPTGDERRQVMDSPELLQVIAAVRDMGGREP